MIKVYLIALGVVLALIGTFVILLRKRNKRIENLVSELKAKDSKIASQTAQIVDAKAKVQEVLNVQKELQRIQEETQAPDKVEPPATGDVNNRLDRFNKLQSAEGSNDSRTGS